MITNYGGRITDIQECYTYQITGFDFDAQTRNEFYVGSVYSVEWLIRSIEERRLLEKE